MSKELDLLFQSQSFDLEPWVQGKVPKHYKRLSVDEKEARRLAVLGGTQIATYYGEKLFYSQAIIAGAVLSGDYDRFTITTCSQYGKSWLMGMLALLQAYKGHKVYIAGGDTNTSSIIMQNVIYATQNVAPEVKQALLNKETQMDKLIVTLSKTRLAFPNGGFVEAITLGDTYKGLLGNKAIGRSGDFIVDEAALITGDALGELGRREFSSVNGEKYQSIMISNPHNPGKFYDDLTCEEPKKGHFILWMDALTAVEEERWTKELVYNSEFNENRDKRTRYLLCNLPDMGDSMFDVPVTYDKPFDSPYIQYFLGVDAAYKGKDNISVALISVDENAVIHAEEIRTVYKGEWIDGVTSERIIDDIAKIVFKLGISCVAVDIGYGVWLNEGLNKRGINAKAINFASTPTSGRVRAKNYAAEYAVNKRAEMHLDLQNLMETKHILFNEGVIDKIKDILPFVTAKINSSGRYQVIPKTEIKAMLGKSPDELDSLLLAIHAMILFTASPYM